MTYFPNFGLLNNMSQHLANNGTPKILDYNINGETGYTYTPASTDLVSQAVPTNSSIMKQQRFNAAIDDLIFSSKNTGEASTIQPNSSDLSLRQESVISSLMNQRDRNTNINQNTSINTSSEINGIDDTNNNSKKEQFVVKPDEPPSTQIKKQNKMNFIAIIIIIFIVFMLIQLYLSQKKMEFLMDIATRQSFSRYSTNNDNMYNIRRNEKALIF